VNALGKIEAVTFDVGGTLIEPWPSVGHVYAGVAAEHGLAGLSAETLNSNFAAAWRGRKNFDHSAAAWMEMVDQSFAGLAPVPPSRTFFRDIYHRFASSAAWRIFDDVVPALSALRQRRLKLAVISNWDERLGPLLRQLGLDRFFQAVVVSHAVGSPKPSPAIFLEAAAQLGLATEKIMHVGDQEQEDIQGAQAAGLQALRIQRGRPRVPGRQIASLSELEWLLAN
jgi:putative hydrolase of the HAD superfamily